MSVGTPNPVGREQRGTAQGGPAPDPSPRRPLALLRALRPYPFEVFTLVNLVAAVLFLRAFQLRIDGKGFWYIVKPLIEGLPVFLAVGLVLAVAATALARRPVVPFLRGLGRPAWVVHWLRLWLAVMLVTYAYGWLKVNVPIVHHRNFDQELWNLDVLLHLGVSPTVFVTQLCAGTPLVGLLDLWYTHWMQTVLFTLCCFTVFLPPPTARRFVFALLMLWGFGAWIYVALPAVGPIYVFPEHWNGLVMPKALGTQASLWANYQIMLGGRTGQIHAFNPILGVAAMPSLHVGVHALFAFWTRRYARPLWIVFLVSTLLTLLGSVLTGWHYAVDGYVGIALAYACFRLANRFEGRPRAGEPDPDPSPGPAPSEVAEGFEAAA